MHGPPPSCPTGDGKEAWTIILEEDLPFVSLRDLLQQFGQQSPVFSKWHDILGDTCVPPVACLLFQGLVPGIVQKIGQQSPVFNKRYNILGDPCTPLLFALLYVFKGSLRSLVTTEHFLSDKDVSSC